MAKRKTAPEPAAKATKSPEAPPPGDAPSLGWTLDQALDAITGEVSGVHLSEGFAAALRARYADALLRALEGGGEIERFRDGTIYQVSLCEWAGRAGIAVPDAVLREWRRAAWGTDRAPQCGSYAEALAAETGAVEHMPGLESLKASLDHLAAALCAFPSQVYKSTAQEYADAHAAAFFASTACERILDGPPLRGILTNRAILRVASCAFDLQALSVWPLPESNGGVPEQRACIASLLSAARRHAPTIEAAAREVEALVERTRDAAAPSTAGVDEIAQGEGGREEPQISDTQSRVLRYLSAHATGKRPNFRASARGIEAALKKSDGAAPSKSTINNALNDLRAMGLVSKDGEPGRGAGSVGAWGLTDAGKKRDRERM